MAKNTFLESYGSALNKILKRGVNQQTLDSFLNKSAVKTSPVAGVGESGATLVNIVGQGARNVDLKGDVDRFGLLPKKIKLQKLQSFVGQEDNNKKQKSNQTGTSATDFFLKDNVLAGEKFTEKESQDAAKGFRAESKQPLESLGIPNLTNQNIKNIVAGTPENQGTIKLYDKDGTLKEVLSGSDIQARKQANQKDDIVTINGRKVYAGNNPNQSRSDFLMSLASDLAYDAEGNFDPKKYASIANQSNLQAVRDLRAKNKQETAAFKRDNAGSILPTVSSQFGGQSQRRTKPGFFRPFAPTQTTQTLFNFLTQPTQNSFFEEQNALAQKVGRGKTELQEEQFKAKADKKEAELRNKYDSKLFDRVVKYRKDSTSTNDLKTTLDAVQAARELSAVLVNETKEQQKASLERYNKRFNEKFSDMVALSKGLG